MRFVLILVACFSVSSYAMNLKKLPPLSGAKNRAPILLFFGAVAAGYASTYQFSKNDKLGEEDLDILCLCDERDMTLYQIHEESLLDNKIQQK